MVGFSRVKRHDVAHFSKGVRKSLTVKYDVYQLATKTKEIKYDMYQLSGIKSLTVRYDMAQLATKAKTITYDIFGKILKTLSIVYLKGSGTGKGNDVEPLPTLDPEPKHKVLNVFNFSLKAGLVDSIDNTTPLVGKLSDEYAGFIKARTNKFSKHNEIGNIKSNLVTSPTHKIDVLGQLKKDSITGDVRAKLNFKPILEMIRRNMLILEGRVDTFSFEAGPDDIGGDDNNDREISFQNPSSFIGVVIYFPDTQDMTITINGKIYNYCGVSQRLYNSFKGAPSPGAFYNREIKGILTCA